MAVRVGRGIFLLLLVPCTVTSVNFPSRNEIYTLTSILEDKLTEAFNESSHINELQTDVSWKDKVSISAVNNEYMVREMAVKISETFASKRFALQRIVDHLEAASETYKWSDELTLNSSQHILLKQLDEEISDVKYKYDAKLEARVNRSQSGVHVPIEVYEGYPIILNGLKWSSGIDAVFKQNYAKDPSLQWQYFGAQTGFMRLYPATTWHVPHELPDLFDARRRPWYIQGSVSPKDMMILMDRSGSVHGQTFTIMKFAVKTLINTLGENDYVNVAAFNETTGWVQNCTQTLVQANTANKKILFDAIDKLDDGGMASYSKALSFAFEALKNMEGEGSNCHKTIMLFSDGGTEWPQEVFDKYLKDNATNDIRIFTYAVGPHPIPTAVLKQMATRTGGQYTVITTTSGVRTKIQESYIDMLSEPLAQSGVHTNHYTSAYTNAVTEDLTVSLTLPVFNKSEEANTSKLLGVAGIDVAVKTLKDLTPFQILGPNGYAFVVNNNGFLVLHPKLKGQVTYLQDLPHVDMTELEGDSEAMKSLRDDMIRGHSGVKRAYTHVILDEAHLILYNGVNYAYAPIKDTPYSLAIVTLPESHHMQVKSQDLEKARDLKSSGVILAPWPYCNDLSMKEDLDSLEELIETILTNFTECNEDLVQGLLWSQEWMESLLRTWRQSQSSSNHIFDRTIHTRYGLTRVHPETKSHIYSDWRDPFKNPALRRGTISRNLVAIPHEDGILLSRPIYVQNSGISVPAAVVGVRFKPRFMNDLLMDNMGSGICQRDGQMVCFLLDDGGLIVASNQQHVGSGKPEFLGDVDPFLMDHLLSAKIYGQHTYYDSQAICSPAASNTSSAGVSSFLSARNPLIALGNMFLDLLSMAGYLQYIVYSAVMSLLTREVDSISEFGITVINNKSTCTTKGAIYYFNEHGFHESTHTCKNTSRKVIVKKMSDINAVLVVAEAPDVQCEVKPVPHKPVRDPGPDPCMLQERFRKPPAGCYKGSLPDPDMESSSSLPKPSFSGVVVFFMWFLKYLLP
ncbi:voltage-dependent calcium channel subunit alpha-2/delta-1-like isoform X2 [Oratosquilla oratoria]|uniref:voltage-dependent calcium channel subunit alpha-2/delta-1-like isoform X2 n=1 Tax=Oratosquilla oratoria TaxID=337810 RepID=UPI003F75886E